MLVLQTLNVSCSYRFFGVLPRSLLESATKADSHISRILYHKPAQDWYEYNTLPSNEQGWLPLIMLY